MTLEDLRMAERRQDRRRLDELTAIRAERFELMAQLAQLPRDLVFYTQITMEAAEDGGVPGGHASRLAKIQEIDDARDPREETRALCWAQRHVGRTGSIGGESCESYLSLCC